MDATSRQVTRDIEVLETIIRLSKREDFAALRAEAERLRESWSDAFLRGTLKSRLPLDQREIDEKRGFWDGIDYILNRMPAQAQVTLKRILENEPEEERE